MEWISKAGESLSSGDPRWKSQSRKPRETHTRFREGSREGHKGRRKTSSDVGPLPTRIHNRISKL
jgi:hypothetical protein